MDQGGVRAGQHERQYDQPFVLMEGDRVALGPLHRDLPYQRWLSAFATTRVPPH